MGGGGEGEGGGGEGGGLGGLGGEGVGGGGGDGYSVWYTVFIAFWSTHLLFSQRTPWLVAAVSTASSSLLALGVSPATVTLRVIFAASFRRRPLSSTTTCTRTKATPSVAAICCLKIGNGRGEGEQG